MSNITETFGDTKISHEYVVDQVMNITECCNFLDRKIMRYKNTKYLFKILFTTSIVNAKILS